MDPIADMFSAIKNAYAVSKETVAIPYSKVKMEIARLLQKEGYIKDAVKRGKRARKNIEIALLYKNDKPAIAEIRRISKPSRRVYLPVKQIRPVMQGYGMMILSTPKGILSGKTAHKEKVGGEVIGEVQ